MRNMVYIARYARDSADNAKNPPNKRTEGGLYRRALRPMRLPIRLYDIDRREYRYAKTPRRRMILLLNRVSRTSSWFFSFMVAAYTSGLRYVGRFKFDI